MGVEDPRDWRVTWTDESGNALTRAAAATISSDAIPLETTHSGGGRAMQYQPGLYDWNGDFECFLDKDIAIPLAGTTMSQLTLTSKSGRAFRGDAFVLGWTLGIDPDTTEVTLHVRFKGASELTII